MRLPWPTPGGWTISSIPLLASTKPPLPEGSPPTPWSGSARRLDADPFVAMYKLRLFAGQPDPANPAHFTLRYELDNRPGTIDGYLLDPPSTQPAPPAADSPSPEIVRFTIRDGQARLTREQIWSTEEIVAAHRTQGLREGKRSWGLWPGD
jgi:hypothetical protein